MNNANYQDDQFYSTPSLKIRNEFIELFKNHTNRKLLESQLTILHQHNLKQQSSHLSSCIGFIMGHCDLNSIKNINTKVLVNDCLFYNNIKIEKNVNHDEKTTIEISTITQKTLSLFKRIKFEKEQEQRKNKQTGISR